MSLPMRRDSIIVVVTVITVAGCSDYLAPNLDACKTKATEARGPQQVRSGYVRECMRAQGWPVRDACVDTPDKWDSPECYLRQARQQCYALVFVLNGPCVLALKTLEQ